MKIIANPRAGHGRGEKNVEKLRKVIRHRGLDCTPILTERPGHAGEIARELAAASEPRLAVMGGDGTIGEVVDAIVGSGTELAVLPTGTGNDVARSLGLPLRDLEAGLEVAFEGAVRPIDVGRERDRHFISVLGIGFPAVVAAEANRITWLKGSAAFFFAVYKALHRMRPLPLVVELDDRRLELDGVAVLVQNTPFTGGGLHMAPGAELDDGILDVVVVEAIGRLDLMVHFPRAYRGRHLEHPRFSLHRSRTVRILSPKPLPKMFDGDLYGATPVEADVVPGGVRFVVPAGSGNDR
ncbi:MAG TPA: diacylglycerol kinase family protein [Gemmatimonadota bacterium]|nr:diacylglycerol kinase family protein [Gemmatimonadota bacterium]